MFEPFFTTKPVGRGSGQGLPLVRSVVQEGHGGSIDVASTLGVGTTFTVRLPVDGRPAPTSDQQDPELRAAPEQHRYAGHGAP